MTSRWTALLLVPVLAGAQVPADGQSTRASVTGVVYDSVAGRPLAGANVQLTGLTESVAGRSATSVTDDEGRFSFQDLLPGRYVAGFFHEILDSMGIEGVPVAVDVGGTNLSLALAVPSSRTIIRTICGPAAVGDSVGMLLGHVFSVDGGPIAGASVTVEWGETLIQRGNVGLRNVASSATTMAPGWYALCDVPAAVELTVSASHGADSSGFITVEVPHSGVRQATLYVGGATRVPGAIVDTLTAVDSSVNLAVEMIWRGDAQLTGVVRDEHGQPVAGARVFVRGTNLSATTNDRGFFGLDSLPGGTHTAEVRAVGYLPTSTTVHLFPDHPVQAEIFIGDKAVTLETVRVQATLVFSRNLAKFQTNRSRNPGGIFVGPAEIERFRGMRFSNLVQNVPGVRVNYTGGFNILMDYAGTDDGQSRGLCVPQIYLDGQRSFYTGAEIEGLYRADELAGVEVYVRNSQRPPEFQDSSSHCGAIIVWTRPALRRPGGQPPPR